MKLSLIKPLSAMAASIVMCSLVALTLPAKPADNHESYQEKIFIAVDPVADINPIVDIILELEDLKALEEKDTLNPSI